MAKASRVQARQAVTLEQMEERLTALETVVNRLDRKLNAVLKALKAQAEDEERQEVKTSG